jgi:presenilin-like A22 family membrane protease
VKLYRVAIAEDATTSPGDAEEATTSLGDVVMNSLIVVFSNI